MSSLVLINGRFDLRAIMLRAVEIARLGGDQPWRRRMVAGLRFAWSMAKTEKHRARAAAATAPAPTPKLVLDRPAAFRLLARIKAHPQNRARDILTIADGLPDLPAVLAFAREEFAKLPVADRPSILAGIGQAEPAPEPVQVRRASFGGPRRGSAFIRGSRAHSHGW